MKTTPFLHLSLLIALALGLQHCKKSEPDPVKPGGTTNPGSTTTTTVSGPVMSQSIVISGIGSASALITAVIDGNGGKAITAHTISVVESDTGRQAKSVALGATSGPFPLTVTQPITGLAPETRYRAYVVVANKVSSMQRDAEFVTTALATAALSSFTQNNVRWVTDYSIQLGDLAVNYAVGARLNETGLCYAENKPLPTIADPKLTGTLSSTITTTAYFTAELTGLKAGTAYYVRPYAIIDGTTHYGSALQITTQSKLSSMTATRRADFPGTTHSNPIQFTLGNKFYVGATQRAANGSTSPTFWFEFDPAANKWTQKNNIAIITGSYAGGQSGVTYTANGKGYFGLSTSFTANTELWEYDPAADKWTRVATGLTNQLRNTNFIIHSQVQVGTKVYLIGSELVGSATTIRFYEYDINARTFTLRTTPGGTSVSSNQLVVLNNTVYYYNLLDKTLAEFSAAGNSWITRNKLPANSSGNTSSTLLLRAVGGKLYALGSETFEYSPSADSWKPVLRLSNNDRLVGTQSFELPDRLYVGLGAGSDAAKWFEIKP